MQKYKKNDKILAGDFEMAKIQDFRKMNTVTTPTNKKKVGAVPNNKNKKKTKKKSSMLLPLCLFILIAIGICIGCLTTPTFNISNITAMNGENVASSEIINIVSYVKGINTFKISLKELASKVEKLPYIKSAKIERKLPNELLVTYEERKPYAIIKYLESYVYMDKFGYVLEVKKENDADDLAIIYGIETTEFVPGKELVGADRLKYENIAYLLETAEQIDFNYKISEINYKDTNDLIISIKDVDIEIEYGNIEKDILNEKLIYLNSILKNIGNKKGTLNISNDNYTQKGVIFKERF